jgi:type I restriction enzyme R subunit
VILSNGLETVMGASHAPYQFFSPWKRLEEGGPEDPSLQTMLRATCEPARFLDLIENFVLFDEAKGGLIKIIGRYHQVLGVNRAIEAVRHIEENQGRLGVFWHTQGSGKSLSMVMFAEKVLRRMGGNYTFVVVTDRTELDDQIAGQFATAGALTKDTQHAQAGSRAHLRDLLAGNERYVFSLIQKFSTDDKEPMPVLSERSDIIVMTDEAHRSQYAQLAANMRKALPNAAFIGFTGTPLIKGDESRTREVFGDYVSIYDFAQSVKDGATVPLFYEGRKPELQLNADELQEELDALLEEAALDEEQEKKLSKQFARQYTLITNPDRLDKVAEDVALHFAQRGYRGKAMFVAIDKATAVAMHDRVKAAVARLIAEDEQRLKTAHEAEGAAIAERLVWLTAPRAVKAFIDTLDDEAQRAAREELTEEELAIFDLLTTPEPKLTKAQEQEVKKVARGLLEKLQGLVDAVDWMRGQETRGAVQWAIKVGLNELPEDPYPKDLWDAKVDQVWDFVLKRYSGQRSAMT